MKILISLPLLLIGFWLIHKISQWFHEFNLRKARPSTPEEAREAVAKMYSQARSDLEKQQQQQDLTIPYLKSIIRTGASFGGDPMKLNVSVMEFIKKCSIDGDSKTYTALSMGESIETAIAHSLFICFENRELNSLTAAEAAKMEGRSISKFERMAWRIVRQLSTTNSQFPAC